MELISVIVPVFNVEKYLENCVTSIINQTYANLEILLIDDGSTDRSGALCDQYAGKDSRIQVIHKTNGGLSDARNVGIDHSHGNYLVFVDSDDLIHATMVERLYHALKEQDAEISLCNWVSVDERYQPLFTDHASPIKDEVLTGEQAIKKLFMANGYYYVVAWNKLYKASLFNDVRFIYGRVNEDEFIVHRLFGQCKSIVCIQDELYYYLQRSDSIMGRIRNSINAEHDIIIAEIMLDRMAYLKTIGLKSYAAEAYQKAAWKYLKIYEFKGKKTSDQKKRIKQIGCELRKHYGLTKDIDLKMRMHLFLICIHPCIYNRCVKIRRGMSRL